MSRLVLIGTGIQIGQITTEAQRWLSDADKVLYCVSDAATERFIIKIAKEAESLYKYYDEGKERSDTYEQMVSRTLECLEEVDTLVVAYYGHPGFFVHPSHKAMRLARALGHDALMLPAVSSFDCMIADLGINVAVGCQIFEATDLLLRQRAIDVCGNIVVLQVSSIGDIEYSFKGFDHRHLPSLKDYLTAFYPLDFEVTAYYASPFPVSEPRIERVSLSKLDLETLKSVATIFIPPLRSSPVHLEMLQRFDLDRRFLNGKTLIPLNSMDADERL